MRRPVIAGNWKMYKTQAEARAYFAALAPLVAGSTHCDIIVAPAFTALAAAVEAVKGTAISIAAQDMHWEAEGAFTGEGIRRDAGGSGMPRRHHCSFRAAPILRRDRRARQQEGQGGACGRA